MTGQRYNRLFQPGDCKPSLQQADHDGWLLLDGRTVRKADYPAFFAKLGIAVDSVALPDTRDRVISGAGGKLKAGASGGSSTVTLTLEHLPPHKHGYADDTVELTPGKAGLLNGVLPILSGGANKALPKTTDMAGGASGAAKAVDLPTPPTIALCLFVFSGRLS